MLLRAFAKINLDLKILGRRSDGYHEIRTILQTIDWFDEIRIEAADSFTFICRGQPLEGADGPSNLVVRAVREYERATGQPVNVHIDLLKNIPSGAGLGGGSSDAAVTILGLQQFFSRELPQKELHLCLRALGSDVPFFAVGGRATGIGRGDEVIPDPDDDKDAGFWLVVVHSGIAISTVEAYSWLTVSDESNTIEGFYAQFDPGREAGLPGNDFESAVFARHPVLGEIKRELLRLGARHAALSGSGSAIFGRFDRRELALKASFELVRYGTARVTRPLSRAEYLQSVFVTKA
jgi:4-diphosphocytidyl-2-C-methyl-D-erythritol kinase